VDNSAQHNRGMLTKLLTNDKTVYLHDGENGGIAQRLNYAAAFAREKGFSWLLTMDQDSFFDSETLTQYLSCVNAYQSAEKVSMFGIEHDERNLAQTASCVFTKTSLLITSGSLVNIPVHTAIGGFDEKLFIDQVDHEYCFRSIVQGYDVLKVQNVLMRHAIGEASTHRSLKSLKRTARALHSPVRLYYMVRNYFYVKEKYKGFFTNEIAAFRYHLFIRIKNNLLYNDNKGRFLHYLFKAYRDFKRGKMGKLTE
jgi:rhamnosyltransferase